MFRKKFVYKTRQSETAKQFADQEEAVVVSQFKIQFMLIIKKN